MTRLFQELNGTGAVPRQAEPVKNAFIRDAAKQGFRLTIPDFIRFCKMANGKDMARLLQELRETGQMDENQFNQCREQAQGFIALLKRFM